MSKHICPECGKPMPAGAPSGKCPTCLLSLALAPEASLGEDALTAPSTAATGDRIGRYKLLEEIGEGGFGTVWMAEQQEPVRRRVALKIIKLGMDTKEVIARFEAERQALAMMDHPNIARVFDGGTTDQGRPFFVMELVKGVRITEYCDLNRLGMEERLELFMKVCQAVQHAHQKGVIHRDLKPSNVLVTVQDDRPVPKVIDFGIAKATEQRLTDKTFFTRLNQVIGTPAYMSPEQAGLGSLDIDTRSDIYALGVLLYELLTGRTPFSNEELMKGGLDEVLRIIREKEPPRPSTRLGTLAQAELAVIAGQRREDPQKLHRLIRGDLDWIVLKALEKDRTRRYETANVLAADLRRYLDNEPILARPPSNLYRFQKLARRNKLLFGAASAVAAALVVGIALASWQAVRATRLATREKQASAEAQTANAAAQRNLAQARLNAYVSEVTVAQQAIAENNLERTAVLLDRQRPKPGEEDLRGFEWRYLWHLTQATDEATFRDVGASVAVAFSPDGKFFAYSGSGKTIVRDTVSHRVVTSFPASGETLSFSPRGGLLATASRGRVKLWDTQTWREARPPLPQTKFPAIFSPDGKWLVTGVPETQTNEFQLWDTETWEVVARCPAASSPVVDWQHRHSTVFSLDGKLLATPWLDMVGGLWGIRLWKVPTLEAHASLSPPGAALSVAFLPDGKHLVTGSWDARLDVWDLDRLDRPIQTEREHTSYITAISVASNLNHFATVSTDGTVNLWDVPTRKLTTRMRGHLGGNWAVAMSPDGALVASGNISDGTTRLWSGTTRPESRVIEGASAIAGFTADSRTLVLAPNESDYNWRLVTDGQQVTVSVPSEPPLKFDLLRRPYDVTGDQPLAVLGRVDGTVELWNLASRGKVASWKAGTDEIVAAVFSRDGAALATGDAAGMVKVWKTATRIEIAAVRAFDSPVNHPWISLRFSPDGKSLAMAENSSTVVRLWNVASQRDVLQLDQNHGGVTDLSFSADGRRFASCSMGTGEAHLWELPSGRPLGPALRGHVTGVTQVAFASPDGRTVATGSYDGKVKLWNVATQQEVATFPVTGVFRGLRVLPDGRTLAVSSWIIPGGRVELYRAPSLEEIAAIEKERSRTLQP